MRVLQVLHRCGGGPLQARDNFRLFVKQFFVPLKVAVGELKSITDE